MLIGTPEEARMKRELQKFLITNLSSENPSIEVLAHGLELLREYVVLCVFPNITLRSFEDQEWFRVTRPGFSGHGILSNSQGYFEVFENSGGNVIWGITRKGNWVLGTLVSRHVSLQISSARDILESEYMKQMAGSSLNATAFVAERIFKFISAKIDDKRRKLEALNRASNLVETIFSLFEVKSQETRR